MNRRTRIIALFVVLFVLQVALLVCWHIESGGPLRAADVAASAATALVMGVIYFFSARYYLRAIDRVTALHAAQASEELERSLELYHSMAEREERLVKRICAAIELELSQAQEDLARGELSGVDGHLMRSLDMASDAMLPHCQNATIAAVLEAVSRQCASEGVELDAKTSIPAEIGLPDIEVAAILFGLADEALRNCRAVRGQDPAAPAAAAIRIVTEAGQLVIETESPRPAPQGKRRGAVGGASPRPRKDWSAKTVEDFVYSRGGIVEYAEDGGISRTSVMIPLGASNQPSISQGPNLPH